MSSPGEQAALSLLDRYAHGFMVSQVLFAACELDVFSVLAEAPEPLPAEAVAARLGASCRGTELLLATCVSLKLLKARTRGGTALYEGTALSRTYLARSSPRCQHHLLLYLARTTYLCWAHLAPAVREGANQYLQAFGVPSAELFRAIYRSEDERLQFMRGLQATWSVHGRRVLAALDLAPFHAVCDLGGCSGALAREWVALYPGCRVTVFDIPEVVQAARKHFPVPEEEGVGFLEGDFFRDPLPEADLYVLARVLHDWTDDQGSQLLARVYEACRPGGGILVIESLLKADGRGPLTTQLYSLNMLVQTEGRERTAAQYHALLAAAGFRDIQSRRTRGTYGAVLGRKPHPAP